jgi:hypothetical protein
VLFGFIADRKIITATDLNTLSVGLLAVITFLYSLFQYSFWTQAIYAFLFGIGMGKKVLFLTLKSF